MDWFETERSKEEKTLQSLFENKVPIDESKNKIACLGIMFVGKHGLQYQSINYAIQTFKLQIS